MAPLFPATGAMVTTSRSPDSDSAQPDATADSSFARFDPVLMMKTSTSSSCYASSRVPSARPSRPVTVPTRHPHELVQTRVPLALAPAPDEPARRHPKPEVRQPSPRRFAFPSVHVQPSPRRFVFPRRPRHPAELLRGTPTDGGGAVGREKRAAAPTRVETGVLGRCEGSGLFGRGGRGTKGRRRLETLWTSSEGP